MRTKLLALAATTVLATTAFAFSSTAAVQNVGTSPSQLIERLVALESTLGALPPTDVLLDPAQTWGMPVGDFVGAQVRLASLIEDARVLFANADDEDGPVAEAVADVAFGMMLLERAYDQLGVWETHDLTRPVGGRDGVGAATGGDEARGPAEIGVDLLLQANDHFAAGYAVLRDTGETSPEIRSLFDIRFGDVSAFQESDRPALLQMVSDLSAQVAATVSRFGSAGDGVSRSRTLIVQCVERDQYDDPASAIESGGFSQAASDDCPDFDGADASVSTR